jgi:hypothetical protein
MNKPPLSRIERVVITILNQERSRGSTTLRDATTLSVSKLLEHQNVDDYVGPAERIMLFRDKVRKIVHSHLKGPFNSAGYNGVKIPANLQLGRLTSWLAIAEGPNALWVPTTKASLEQLQMNYEMKRKKRRQSQDAERITLDLKNWLEDKGYSCLEDANG